MAQSSDVTVTDGSLDFSGGINSLKVTTIQSASNPNGLKRNELAFLTNATVRDGGILQRTGWQPRQITHDSTGLFQGGSIYNPDNANPYLIVSISGHIYRQDLEAPYATTELINQGPYTAKNPKFNPPAEPQAYFCQGENYLIIQAGDNATLPLFWDGAKLTRSIGINNTAVGPGTPGVNQLPAATAMDYFMGRIWYGQGRQVSAGDIVGGNSGTAANKFRDAILNVTENPLVVGGDGFTLPDNSGNSNVRAISHNANINAALGQGNLYIFTRGGVYQLQVPVTRANWIAATGSNAPLLTVIQINYGSVNDRSVVKVNGDLFYQSLEPQIRSLFASVRNFGQWGNIAISNNEQRVLQFEDRSLLRFVSGIYFDNRLLMSAVPVQRPQGVVSLGIIPLDFVPISSFGASLTPNWEGWYQGVPVLQLFVADFGGLERAFAMVVSQTDSSIQLWELTNSERFENGHQRVEWIIEFPAFTAGDEFEMKKLVAGECWLDKILGEVIFKMEYRPDGDACWHPWYEWKLCSLENTCQDITNPCPYPVKGYREGFRQTGQLPTPQIECQTSSGRPANVGYQFQPRLTIKGWCRVRGVLLYFEKVKRPLWANMFDFVRGLFGAP